MFSPSGELLPLPTGAEMREVERVAFSDGGLNERVVLESAGRAAATFIAEAYPEGRVVAAVGRGNNGGDAVVALRTLRAWGRDVLAVPVAGGSVPHGLTHGWEIPISDESSSVFASAGVIVDGVLGTGASGAPRSPVAETVEMMNAAGPPIVALDGPTGVDLGTGAAPGAAIRAEATVTFGAIKRGLILFPGRQHAGRIVLAEVGFPPIMASAAAAALITDGWARDRLPQIPPDTHKTAVGLVGVVAGRQGVGGAAIMATMGALRAGCGGVRVASAEANRLAIHAAVAEAVFLDRESESLLEDLQPAKALLIGPGIGTDESAGVLMRSLLHGFSGPILLDADAITLLAHNAELIPADAAPRCLLTPHPGELGRLLGRTTDAVLSDRFGAAKEAADRFGCTVLAKGAPSIVATRDGPVLVSVSGHTGVATGGMGDTLGGIVAALLAAGLGPRDAAAVGLHYAGRAAEAAGRGRGLLPRDVAEALPHVLMEHSMQRRPAGPLIVELPSAR